MFAREPKENISNTFIQYGKQTPNFTWNMKSYTVGRDRAARTKDDQYQAILHTNKCLSTAVLQVNLVTFGVMALCFPRESAILLCLSCRNITFARSFPSNSIKLCRKRNKCSKHLSVTVPRVDIPRILLKIMSTQVGVPQVALRIAWRRRTNAQLFGRVLSVTQSLSQSVSPSVWIMQKNSKGSFKASSVVYRQRAGLCYLSSRVQTRPKPSDFSGRRNPQHAFLRRGNKAVCPMSQIYGM